MTLAAVSTPVYPASTQITGAGSATKTFTLAPHGAGNFILLEVISETAADTVTGITSGNGNVTWSVLVSATTIGSVSATVFIGKVNSTSSGTQTIATSAGSPQLRFAGQEFSTTAGFAAVTLDKSGTVNTTTLDYPSLTPGHGAGGLYFGYAFNGGSGYTPGSTTGYTYLNDSSGNGLAFNPACGSGAQQPVWAGTADTLQGIAVLLYEAAPTSHTATASETVTPSESASGTAAGPKLENLTDAFPGTTLNEDNWVVEPDATTGDPSGPVSVSGGQLILGGTTEPSGYTSVNSAATNWALANSSAFVKVILDLAVTGSDTGYGYGDDGLDNGWTFGIQDGNLYVQTWSGGIGTQVSPDITYLTDGSMAWLRIREDSGELFFETASDPGGTWTTQFHTTTETSWPVTSGAAQLFYGAATGQGTFEDFNTLPSGGETDTLFGQPASPTVDGSGAGNNGSNGLHFTVSEACTLDGIWHYSPSSFGGATVALPATIGLYTTQSSPVSGTLVHSETASWSGAAGSGWVFAPFASPPSLSTGTDYMAVQFLNDAVSEWFVFDDAYTWPATSSGGIITAPDDTGAGQGWYNSPGTALAFPSAQFAGFNYWMDVQVSTSSGTPHTATASLDASPSESATAERTAAARTATATLGVTPETSATALHGTPHEAAATLGVDPALSAEREHGATAGAGLDVTPGESAEASRGQSATASLGVDPDLSAEGGHAREATAELDVAPEESAEREHGATASATADVAPEGSALAGHGASLDVAPGLSAEASHGYAAQASLSVDPDLTAEREHDATASAGLDVAPETTAGSLHGTAHSATAELGVAPATEAEASRGQEASATLGVAPVPAAGASHGIPHTVTATLGVTPSATAAASRTQVASATLPVAPAVSATPHRSTERTATATLSVAPAFRAKPRPPFPASPLGVRCELQLGTTWTDVTQWAYQRDGTSPPVSITRGRPDESSQANPSQCTWEWNNRDGRFSPKNPLSPYYGMLGRNTPVRWSVPAVSSYLRLEGEVGSYASTPEASQLDVTGSIDVRVALRLTDWHGADLCGKYDGSAHSSWIWNTAGDGTLEFWWNDASGVQHGVASTASVPYASGDFALRVTMDATDGTVTYYTSDSIDGEWTQLEEGLSGSGGAATSVHSGSGGTVALTVGWSVNNPTWQVLGRVYEFRLYDGIAAAGAGSGGSLDTEAGGGLLLESGGALEAEAPGSGGTLVADAGFSKVTAGAASWTDSTGLTWSLAGDAEVSDRDFRFSGEMSAQPPKWDVTGRDHSVMAQAGGPLRRLSQGTNNAMSAIKRAILLQTGAAAPVAYWPMEDAAGASVFGSATGGAPMTFDASPAPTLATDSSFIASAPLPSLNGSRLQAPVPPYTDTGAWTVSFLLNLSSPSVNATLLRIVASPWAACPVIYINVQTDGQLEFVGYAQDGSEAFNTGFFDFSAPGNPLMVSVSAQPSTGGQTEYNLFTLVPGASSGFILTESASGEAGTVSLVQPDTTGAFGSTVAGHLQVQPSAVNGFSLGQQLNAWTGEAATDRYARLCSENGYTCRILGYPSASAVMGPQGIDTLQDLLQECETADLGQQFEPRQVTGLGYRTLASMCGQVPALTLDYTASEPGGVSGGGETGLEPTYDDQLLKNDWTVTRGSSTGSEGGTVQVQLSDGSPMSVSNPPAGAGDYANTQTVNCEYDDQLQDVGGWMVHTGTIDEARWPVIPVNLARAQAAARRGDAMALEVGDFLQVDDAPDLVVYDPVKQVMLGSAEKLGGFHWTMEFNAVPESAYEVVILDDPDHGRVDTDGSTLHAAATATATTLSVASAGITWTTGSGDLPFDVNVGGERVTVTAVSGSSSPQTFTVTRSVNGVVKSQSAGTDVRLWFAPVLALT